MSRFSWLIRNGIPWEHRFPCDSLALPRHAVTQADVTISPELPVLLCERKYRSATAPCGKGAIEARERRNRAHLSRWLAVRVTVAVRCCRRMGRRTKPRRRLSWVVCCRSHTRGARPCSRLVEMSLLHVYVLAAGGFAGWPAVADRDGTV